MRGGNLEEMQKLAKTYSRNAKQLAGIIKDLNSKTSDSNRIWSGPAAERFRSAWDDARGSFDKMQQALEDASSSVSKSARNIESSTS